MAYQPRFERDYQQSQTLPLAPFLSWKGLMVSGFCWLVLGLIAIWHPFAATLGIELLIAALLVVGGIVQLAAAVVSVQRGFWATLISGIANLTAGILLFVAPVGGIFTITLVIGVLLIVDGCLRLVYGLVHPGISGRFFPVLNGSISLLLGGLILLYWPGASLVFLGFIFGVALLITGLTSIGFALNLKSISR